MVKTDASSDYTCIDSDPTSVLNCVVFQGFTTLLLLGDAVNTAIDDTQNTTIWDYSCKTCSEDYYLTEKSNCCPHY